MIKVSLPSRAWMLGNFLGWFLGIVVVLLFSGLLEAAGFERFQFHVGLGMGLSIGFFQWRLLKPWLKPGTGWIWYCALGLAAPLFLGDLIGLLWDLPKGPYRLFFSVAIGAAFAGWLQKSRLAVANGKGWIAGSFLSWMSAVLAVLLVDFTRYLSGNNLVLFVLNLGLILSGGLLLGWISKSALLRMTGEKS